MWYNELHRTGDFYIDRTFFVESSIVVYIFIVQQHQSISVLTRNVPNDALISIDNAHIVHTKNIVMPTFAFNEMHLNMSSEIRRQFCCGLNVKYVLIACRKLTQLNSPHYKNEYISTVNLNRQIVHTQMQITMK